MNDRGYRWAAFTHGARYSSPMHAQLLQAEYAARVIEEQLAAARAAGYTVINDEIIVEGDEWIDQTFAEELHGLKSNVLDEAEARGYHVDTWLGRPRIITPHATVRCATWEQAYYFVTGDYAAWWKCYNPVR